MVDRRIKEIRSKSENRLDRNEIYDKNILEFLQN